MAVWYEVEKTEQGFYDFLECNWEFHDFRIEKVEYTSKKDMVEIFLKYDTGVEGVLLRFVGIQDMHIITERDYEADWICESSIIGIKNNMLIWLDNWNLDAEHMDELEQAKICTTWVEAEWLFWAVTDAEGNPVEMPADRIDQEWEVYGTVERKHFNLKEFKGNWDVLLRTYFW